MTKVVDRPRRTSLAVKNPNILTYPLNSRVFGLLASIAKLKDNWDDDEAKAPAKEVLTNAAFIALYLDATGQKIYNIAPGPNGEIMVDIRVEGRSVELLFYPNKSKFVKFADNELPEQGLFTLELLPQLMSWVNAAKTTRELSTCF